MAIKINPTEIEKELKMIYLNFVKNPDDPENLKKINALWTKLDMSTGYSFYNSVTETAIGGLDWLIQSEKHHYYTRERVMKKAKEILRNLEQNQE